MCRGAGSLGTVRILSGQGASGSYAQRSPWLGIPDAPRALSLSEGLCGDTCCGANCCSSIWGLGWRLLRWGWLNCSVGAFSTQYT
jgi:hypothetical protein